MKMTRQRRTSKGDSKETVFMREKKKMKIGQRLYCAHYREQFLRKVHF